MARKNTWVWILVFGLIGAIVLVVALIAGAGFYFYARHVEVQTATRQDAEREFEQTRQRFAGQQPLLRIERGDPVIAREERLAEGARRPIENLHVLVWDPADDRLVRVTLPMWLLRLGRRGQFSIGGDSRRLEDLRLTVDDLERAGPGLILDHEEDDGERVLVWAQ